MNIRTELKQQIQKETIAAKRLNEIDQQRQINKIKQKKRKDDLEFYAEINRLMEAF